MRNAFRLPIALIAFVFAGCGGSSYLNRSYTFDLPKFPKVALAPVLPDEDSLATFVDTEFVTFFKDKNLAAQLVSAADIRNLLKRDKAVIGALATMNEVEFSKEQMKVGPSVAGRISLNDLSRVRGALGDADLLLIPKTWRVAPMAMHTFGACTFRLFDLRTGQMVTESTHDINVNMQGEIAAKNISILLIDFVSEHYKNNVLARINNGK